MPCYKPIHSAGNNLKIITIWSIFYKYFASTYYNDKRDSYISILENKSSRVLYKLIILR